MSQEIDSEQISYSRHLLDALRIDPMLLALLFILSAIGVVLLYSASGADIDLMIRQAVRLSIAFVLLVAVANIPLRLIRKISIVMYLFGVVLLLAVMFFGEIGKGAQRWLNLGFIRFQPSEILKLAVPMVVAAYLSNRLLPVGWKELIVSVVLVIIPVIMIARQPDLGTAILVGSAGFFVLFLAGVRWRIMIVLGVLLSFLAPILWKVALHDYQRLRILTLLNPESDPLGSGYHIIQSKIAIGSGGVYGKGWLNGTQSQLDFIPERSTDFIFSVFGEEFGFFGSALLVLLYLVIIYRGLYIAANSSDNFGRLLAGALSLTFFVYLFVNTGMVTGMLPVVGVPLPLISYGGTSMVTLMAGFGLMMAIRASRRFWDN
ncbi:MAG: rod shape-determining protein RodA [Gammaproteobacteria bacterium]|nr:rod shape-determining protein RodA [Gammaproteobacteria bacterium]